MAQVNLDIQPVNVIVEDQPIQRVTIIAQGPQGPLTSDITELEERVTSLETGIDGGEY